jgi:hypothetical protein
MTILGHQRVLVQLTTRAYHHRLSRYVQGLFHILVYSGKKATLLSNVPYFFFEFTIETSIFSSRASEDWMRRVIPL